MRKLELSIIAIFAIAFFSACSPAADSSRSFPQKDSAAREAPATEGARPKSDQDGSVASEDVPLDKADSSSTATRAAITRKIIRNAELRLESVSPEKVQEQITAIAEKLNGFVISSTQQAVNPPIRGRRSVQIEIRVPAAKFADAVKQIRDIGDRVILESVTGQDVTEEYIDIEARLRTKKALEAQFIEIMKRSRTVAEALNVQRELSNVRGEIERIEGRMRFLDNRTSLSTISVAIQTPTSISGSSGGFFYELKEAVSSGFDAASTFILVLIRVLIAILPFLILIVLPFLLLLRYLWRKYRRTRFAKEFAKTKPVGIEPEE